MDSKELLNKISVEQIVGLMVNYYGIEMKEDTDPLAYIFATRCHHSFDEEASFKLYLYKENKTFVCYSSCGSMSLFDFVMTMNDCTFAESVQFLEEYFHIGINFQRGFGRPKREKIEIKPYVKKEVDFNEQLPEYDGSILNTFINFHAVEWLEEGISHETMDKYGIKYDIETQGVVIPHYDKDSRLVGIRERNLDKRQIDMGRKYVPYTSFTHRKTYKHKLSMNAYGIDKNKEAISEYKKCIIFEAEKSVLKMDTIYGNNPSVAVGGSSISEYQLNLLKTNGCEKVYLAFDREDGEKWESKLDKICQRIVNFGLECYVIEDKEGKYLDLKMSPIDNGREVFEILLREARKYE